MRTKIAYKMNVSATITEKLLNDRNFRLNTAIALNVTEKNVANLAKASSDCLTKYAAILYFRSCGLSDEEIFDVPALTTAL